MRDSEAAMWRFGIRLAPTRPNSNSRQHRLSLPERRNIARVESPVRETFGGRRINRPTDRAVFWHLRRTQRQVWCSLDVSNRQEGLAELQPVVKKRHRSKKT